MSRNPDADAGASYSAAGKIIQCSHCGGNTFSSRRLLMNTPGLTFFNLDWANKQATVLACVQCGLAQWFVEEPEAVP